MTLRQKCLKFTGGSHGPFNDHIGGIFLGKNMSSKESADMVGLTEADLSTPHGQAQAKFNEIVQAVKQGFAGRRYIWFAPGEEPVAPGKKPQQKLNLTNPIQPHQQTAVTPDSNRNQAAWCNPRNLKSNGKKKGPGRYQ